MEKQQYLYLNTRDEFYRIDISKIVYFESDGNYTHMVLNNGTKGTLGMNLASMQSTLVKALGEKSSTFVRVGKRHIINQQYIFAIMILRQRMVLSDGENFEYVLPVSKEALKALRDLMVSNSVKR